MGKCVMVVDDDVNIRTAVKLRLERDALTVLTAANGDEALRQIAEQRPDLVILDLFLPVRDGYAVLSELKRSEVTANIPVIVLTAHHRCREDNPALLSASDEIIVKPFSPRYLAQRVHAHLERRSKAVSTPASRR